MVDKKKGPKDKKAGQAASTEGDSVVAPPTSNGAEEAAETTPKDDTPPPALAPDEQLVESAKGLDLAQSKLEDNFLPTRLSLRPPRSLEMTLFGRLERLYGPAIKRILTIQYRCVVSVLASNCTGRASDVRTFGFFLLAG